MPLRTLVRDAIKGAPLVVNHQGQFPSVTISYNLVPGTSIGDRECCRARTFEGRDLTQAIDRKVAAVLGTRLD